MCNLEKKIVDALLNLKNNCYAIGVKAEFEAEGAFFDEVLQLKKFLDEVGFDLTVKIGGCEAIRDILDAKILNAKTIVAPMIETPYALRKFVCALDKIYTESEQEKMEFLINIETVSGYNNFQSIIEQKEFSKIDGVVFGRDDMAASIDLTSEDVNNDKFLKMANFMAEELDKLGKKIKIGGAVSVNSLPFFKLINNENFCAFETRKIIFDAKKVLSSTNKEMAVISGLEFEMLWLEYRKNFSKSNLINDDKRLQILKERCKI